MLWPAGKLLPLVEQVSYCKLRLASCGIASVPLHRGISTRGAFIIDSFTISIMSNQLFLQGAPEASFFGLVGAVELEPTEQYSGVGLFCSSIVGGAVSSSSGVGLFWSSA